MPLPAVPGAVGVGAGVGAGGVVGVGVGGFGGFGGGFGVPGVPGVPPGIAGLPPLVSPVVPPGVAWDVRVGFFESLLHPSGPSASNAASTRVFLIDIACLLVRRRAKSVRPPDEAPRSFVRARRASARGPATRAREIRRMPAVATSGTRAATAVGHARQS
jgi:hypothetical protein